MFLLIRFITLSYFNFRIIFTFHNVSINTLLWFRWKVCIRWTLHSTMFLLIHRFRMHFSKQQIALHSTMFLLILSDRPELQGTHFALHSTMFLLIRRFLCCAWCSVSPLHSTMFLLILHRTDSRWFLHLSLHSTMFLLIQRYEVFQRTAGAYFTFHNVSINTAVVDKNDIVLSCFTFHNVSINTSVTFIQILAASFFTFHNVSINTFRSAHLFAAYPCFTFHNVSINTKLFHPFRAEFLPLHSTMFLLIHEYNIKNFRSIWLYIPQCFY